MNTEAPEWGNDDDENNGERQNRVEFDPFGEFRTKMFNVLCMHHPDVAHAIDFDSNIDTKNRLSIGISFDDETFECNLVVNLILARNNVGQHMSSFGRIGETLTRAAQLSNALVMGTLRFIPPHERETLVQQMRDQRDQILLDMEEAGQWEQRQDVTDRIERICTDIMEILSID